MSIVIYVIAIAMWVLLCTWTWHSAKLLENNKTKLIYIAIGIAVLAIITIINFNISKSGVTYPNEKMIAPVRRMIMIIFTPVNGFFAMPYLALQIGKLNTNQIKEENFRKKIITLIIIFIVVLIIECSYFKNIQNGILGIYQK